MSEELAAAAQRCLTAGNLPEAERLARLALRQVPRDVGALTVLGLVETMTGRLGQAEETLQAALRIDSKSVDALNALSTMYRLRGQVPEAVRAAEQALSIDPQSADAHANLGAANLARSRFDLAVQFLKSAVQLAPSNSAYRHDLGLALLMIGAEKGAEAQFREAIRLDPVSPGSFAKLGRILRLRGDVEGERLYDRAFEASFEQAERLVELGNGLADEEEPVWAVRVLRRALDLQPENDYAHALLGRILPQIGAFEEAQAELDTAIRLRPTAARPYVDKVYVKRVGESDLPLVRAMQELVVRPDLTLDDRRNLHYALGKSLEDLGRYEEAIRHYDEANGIMHLLAPGGSLDRRALTAWYERLTRLFNRQALSLIAPGTDSDRPILIVGMIRSGTTLVEQLLSNHPEVGGGGEVSFLSRAYSALIRETELDAKLAVPFAERYLRILTGRAPGKLRVTDKMPMNFVALGVVSALMPNARIIHVRRQPIDNALAIYVTPFTQALEFAHSKEDIVFFYRAYQRLMAHWREVLPADRFLEVDYEAIVSDTEPNVRKMVEFCGLPWSDSCLRPDLNETPIFTPSAWQARQPIFRTSVDRWRRFEPWLGPLRELQERPEIQWKAL